MVFSTNKNATDLNLDPEQKHLYEMSVTGLVTYFFFSILYSPFRLLFMSYLEVMLTYALSHF